MPEGYEPIVPLSGDPTGYSYSYQAGDHHRQEMSDGKGNYFSSFSFIPPGSSPAIHSTNGIFSTLDYGLSRTSSPTVNIQPRRPLSSVGLHHAATSTRHSFNPSTTASPLLSPSPRSRLNPTTRPLVGSSPQSSIDPYANGFYFESKRIPTERIPQRTFQDFGHALSTNIQHDNSVTKTSSIPTTGSRRVTIEPPSSPAPPVNTDRSYQTLSRSLALAYSTQRPSTLPPRPLSSTFVANQPVVSPSTVRPFSDKTRSPAQFFRSASRRSTTERPDNSPRSETSYFSSSTKKPSVVQKIPRKLKYRNTTVETRQLSRPAFIDDLTSLAYSSDNATLMNNTIIQIKGNDYKSEADRDEKLIGNKLMTSAFANNFSSVSDIIKDGYVTGNKTYLAGLGLRSNIHY